MFLSRLLRRGASGKCGRRRGRGGHVRQLGMESLEPRQLLAGATVDYVVQVVFDGFRSDTVETIGAAELPNVYRMINEGSWTDNARTDYTYTSTLQNHVTMLTSRPSAGDAGHGVDFNFDDGSTVHDTKGSYVTSVFDVIHDNGLRTGLYGSKLKFDFVDRSWNADNGRPDTIGEDNGPDKIDVYQNLVLSSALKNQFIADMTADPFDYAMVTFRDPDVTGHTFGWMSDEYLDAVRSSDGYLGDIFAMIDGSPQLSGNTAVILTSDHGGTGIGHGSSSEPVNYTIPFLVWGPPVVAGGDLYTMNRTTRSDPGTGRPDDAADPQPIRNGDSGNLALQLLGLGAIDDSVFNAAQDLALKVEPDLVGVHRNRNFLVDANASGKWDGVAGGDMVYAFGGAGDLPIVGDFNGDGYDEIGVYRVLNKKFYIDYNGNGRWDTIPGGDRVYRLGGFDTDLPIIGDWNGDGVDDIGLYRGKKFLVDYNGNGQWNGPAGGDRVYAIGGVGDLPLVGDFNGDGADEAGVFREINKRFYLDYNGNGRWDGTGEGNDRTHDFRNEVETPLTGDWNGDGVDEIGDRLDGLFFLDLNANGTWDRMAGGDLVRAFGVPADTPLRGKWRPPEELVAAELPEDQNAAETSGVFETPESRGLPKSEPLTPEELAPVVQQAIDLWSATPLSVGQQDVLQQLNVHIAQLPGATLGRALGTTIWIDADAAGHGWDLGRGSRDQGRGSRVESGEPEGADDARMDLVSAVMHEIGHLLGYDHGDGSVMQETLSLDTQLVWEVFGSDESDEVW